MLKPIGIPHAIVAVIIIYSLLFKRSLILGSLITVAYSERKRVIDLLVNDKSTSHYSEI